MYDITSSEIKSGEFFRLAARTIDPTIHTILLRAKTNFYTWNLINEFNSQVICGNHCLHWLSFMTWLIDECYAERVAPPVMNLDFGDELNICGVERSSEYWEWITGDHAK